MRDTPLRTAARRGLNKRSAEVEKDVADLADAVLGEHGGVAGVADHGMVEERWVALLHAVIAEHDDGRVLQRARRNDGVDEPAEAAVGVVLGGAGEGLVWPRLVAGAVGEAEVHELERGQRMTRAGGTAPLLDRRTEARLVDSALEPVVRARLERPWRGVVTV